MCSGGRLSWLEGIAWHGTETPMKQIDTKVVGNNGLHALHGQTGGADAPLRSLARRPPLIVPPAIRLRDVLYCMNQTRADAAVVADELSELPLGLVTLSDMLHVVTFEGASLDEPVAAFMTGGPISLPADAPAHRAKVLMTKRNLRYVVLVEADGRLCNLVSQADLFGFHEGGADALVEGITAARDLDAMVKAADAVRRRGTELFTAGMSVESLCQWLSGLNDLVRMRVIEIIEDEFDLPAVPWCWLVFGSEGRLEQTFATDQDNGLIFLPGEPEDTERLRQSLLPFAQAVNKALHYCGFERCTGNIMAGNPAWCLSEAEWQDRFDNWIRAPDPQALLHSTIFFDFRPLYGRYELADDLRRWLLPRPSSAPLFLRALAEQALGCAPALNWVGNFIYDGGREHPHTLDLKKRAIRPFVDAARIWSLAHGIWATNTAERLRAAGAAIRWAPEDSTAVAEAFHLVQRFRIRQQLVAPDARQANRLNPASLNDLYRLMLKEALKQAKRLQAQLKQDYGL